MRAEDSFLNIKDHDILTHLGDEYEKYLDAVIPPIFMNSLHVTPKSAIGSDTPREYVYGRVSNPTVNVFERKVAALERADIALAFGSGMAAITTAILACVKSGDHIVCVETAYGPARIFITEELCGKFNLEATFVAGDDISQFEAAVKPNTALFYLESPSSMVFILQDLEKVAGLAKARGIKTIVRRERSCAHPCGARGCRDAVERSRTELESNQFLITYSAFCCLTPANPWGPRVLALWGPAHTLRVGRGRGIFYSRLPGS